MNDGTSSTGQYDLPSTSGHSPDLTKFREAVERRRREKEAVEAAGKLTAIASSPGASFDADLIPDVEASWGLSPYDLAVDEACATITLKEVYDRLSKNKYESGHERRTGESIKISCPNPRHPDKNPSAWFNSDGGKDGTGVGYCEPCGLGFDKYDVAAWTYGDSVPEYRRSRDFYEVKCRMARDLRGVHKPPLESPAEPAAVDEPEPEPTPEPASPAADLPGTTYDWRAVLKLSPVHQAGGTSFLWEYCSETAKDTTPEEFNLFNGLLGVGMVAGNNITSEDVRPLSANFGVCFVADSGAGKSRSTKHIVNMLRRVAPAQPNGTGVQIKSTVFSGQAMVAALDHREEDPSNPAGPDVPVPVHALFEYPELSEIAGGAGLQGSILKSKIQEVLDHESRIQYESKGAGIILAQDAFASIVTTTQPKLMKDLLSKSDAASGFMNRFLFPMGTPKEQLARGRTKLSFDAADAELTAVASYAATRRDLDWDADADDYWEKVFRGTVEPYQKADTHDILTRLDLNLKRMILAFAVNERTESIAVHHVQMAEALIPYLVKCYERVIGALLHTENREITEWLLQKIQDLEANTIKKAKKEKKPVPANPGPSQADLRRYYGKKNWEDWRVTRGLRELVDAGLVHESTAQGKRGSTTKRYQIIG